MCWFQFRFLAKPDAVLVFRIPRINSMAKIIKYMKKGGKRFKWQDSKENKMFSEMRSIKTNLSINRLV